MKCFGFVICDSVSEQSAQNDPDVSMVLTLAKDIPSLLTQNISAISGGVVRSHYRVSGGGGRSMVADHIFFPVWKAAELLRIVPGYNPWGIVPTTIRLRSAPKLPSEILIDNTILVFNGIARTMLDLALKISQSCPPDSTVTVESMSMGVLLIQGWQTSVFFREHNV